jgi:hypothetical protein
MLPRALSAGQTAAFSFDLAPPEGGWKKGARLRVQTLQPRNGARFEVKWNALALTPTDDVSEPFSNPYPPLLGTSETLAAWTVPASVLRTGPNRLAVTLVAGDPLELAFLDLAAG